MNRLEYDLFELAKARFGEAGIEIPYPYQNVVLMGGAERLVTSRPSA